MSLFDSPICQKTSFDETVHYYVYVFFITGLATAAANFYRPGGFQQIMKIQKCIHYPHLNGKIAPSDGNASLESLSGFS